MEGLKQGHLFVISGPSGAGKGAICDALKEKEETALSVSMTTRAPRPHEIEGVSYFFVTRDRFREAIREGGLLEYTEVFGEYYGTPKAQALEQLEKDRDVILEIEINGAKQVRGSMPESVLVFILPPSRDELKRRIEGRGTESGKNIAQRLDRAEREIAQLKHYDYYVVNDELESAISDVEAIIRKERLTVAYGEDLPDTLTPEELAVFKRAGELEVGSRAKKIVEGYRRDNLKKVLERLQSET